jgi:DNA-3-methyladenine glycosylase
MILKQPTRALNLPFYQRADVLAVARELLGMRLVVLQPDGSLNTGRIVETEAYAGAEDRASHAHGHRRTARTETMYRAGGVAYVYLCYGIHHLLNVVTHQADVPHAVLIRGVSFDPALGLSAQAGAGPGKLTKALGVTRTAHNGLSLLGPELWISEGIAPTISSIRVSPRIGVDYAGDDAWLPYRYYLAGEPGVSKYRAPRVPKPSWAE